MAIELLQHVVLTSNTTQVSFTGIPQDGQELMLFYSARSSQTSGAWASMFTRINNSSSSLYNTVRGQQYYNSVDGAYYQNRNFLGENLVPVISNQGEDNILGSGKIHFFDYASTEPTPYFIQSGASMHYTGNGSQHTFSHGYFDSNVAVTYITTQLESGHQWEAGSMFSLYKIS